ncbi:MAG: S-methyl-5-thioribose-1-phosphate isomerase, partial [Methylophilaceae bacterium]
MIVEYINQNKLPHQLLTEQAQSYQQIIHAISSMQVRGAPLIGATGAYGMALACAENPSDEALKQAAHE